MSEKVYSPGDEVDSWCTTCKLVLGHRVVALVDGNVDKVICSTCNKKHKYRPNPPKSRAKKTATAKDTTPKKRVTRRRVKDPALIWEETLNGRALSDAAPYSFTGKFEENELIEHKNFGCGLVMRVMGEGKMEVLFKEGTKILVCGQE
ncbi:hypothetical protein CSB45_08730 [candidate division KSB3 bacterium]|uniref:Uncharacterized protein n=1 Tax=candidate division KSB3 bacterium TaxID=2044937 RepID=A0A2G6E4K7_9BACT|nr:MAG: hypothetical protein CSB45_08730 [candidate division KSB3 bacterium]PIE29694.1 MAG: hypothetical protein CSA57_07705 [candidate division KSB3 bacterium]